MMPHPERTENGDPIFSSLKEFIENKNPVLDKSLVYKNQESKIRLFQSKINSKEWVIDQIITDNEESSVQKALRKKGFDVSIHRQAHWEISIKQNIDTVLKSINHSGELFNSNKEYISKTIKKEKTATFLIRKKDDILARAKAESLKEKFQIEGITNLKYGVIWNITVNKGNLKSVLNQLINTQILFNTLSHECYRIN
jgi:phosphoribosylformylglycinamidine synthase